VNLIEAKNAFSRGKPLLTVVADLVEAVEKASDIEAEVKALEARRIEAEDSYRQAYAERGQIIEAIVNLKAQYAQLGQDLGAKHAKSQESLAEAIRDTEIGAQQQINESKSLAEKAEADAKQRIEAALAAADLAEARAVKAQEALDALKRA
jgi:hypothetical protein